MNKKKKILLFLAGVILVVSLALFMDYLQYLNKQPTELENITIEIKEGTLTKTGATIIITDFNKKKNIYSEEYRIDQKRKQKWKELEGNEVWFDLIGHLVDENHQLERKLDWKARYGELKPGEYRIVTPVNGDYIAVKFTIE